MYLLYCGLLVIWVPLLWLMVRLNGGARLWLVVVIGAGVIALIYEIRMFLWSFAAIRLDILVISVALVCLYGSAVVLLFFKHWRRVAALLAIALVLIGGDMSYKWILVGRESQRLGEVFSGKQSAAVPGKVPHLGSLRELFRTIHRRFRWPPKWSLAD